MKAILYSKTTAPHKLILVKTEVPKPGPDQALIKVQTSSPNAADYRSIKMGLIPKSKVFGSAVSGVITQLGENIQGYQVGDEVLADLTDSGFGGFAEYALAGSEALALKPKDLSFELAACLPVAATTALNAIRAAAISSGTKVLILGASGGVGSYAIQLAKLQGASVTAVCSERNKESALNQGADSVLNYEAGDPFRSAEKYDIILAINGHYPLLQSLKHLNDQGRYIAVGGSLSQIFKALLLGPFLSMGSKKVISLRSKVKSADLDTVAQLATEEKLRIPMDLQSGFLDIPETMSELSAGHAQGKKVFSFL